MTQIIRSLRSGQITIPAPFREKLGIDNNSLLQLTLVAGELRIKPVKVMGDKPADSAWLKELYNRFSQVRVESKRHSDKEINKSIDQAVTAARSSHD